MNACVPKAPIADVSFLCDIFVVRVLTQGLDIQNSPPDSDVVCGGAVGSGWQWRAMQNWIPRVSLIVFTAGKITWQFIQMEACLCRRSFHYILFHLGVICVTTPGGESFLSRGFVTRLVPIPSLRNAMWMIEMGIHEKYIRCFLKGGISPFQNVSLGLNGKKVNER